MTYGPELTDANAIIPAHGYREAVRGFGEEGRCMTGEKKPKQRRGLVQLPPNKKNGAPRWRASYWFMGRWKRRTFSSKTEAVRWLDSQRGSVADGRHPVPGEEVLFEKAVEEFLAWSKTNTRDNGHEVDTMNAALWLASPCFAGKPLAKITALDVEEYRRARLKEEDRRGPSTHGLVILASKLHKAKAGRWLKGRKRAVVKAAIQDFKGSTAPARLRAGVRAYFERPEPISLETFRADLEAWLKVAPQEGHGRKIAKRTADISLGRLKRLFNLCVEWDFCDKNPAARVKLLREDNRRNRYLSLEEETRLLSVCSPYLRRVVLFALHTGMRRGEILGLRWQEIDSQNSVVIIPGTRAKGKRDRYIPLNGPALAILEDLRKQAENAGRVLPLSGENLAPFPERVDGSKLVFPNQEGKYQDSFEHKWRAALVLSGVENFRFHDLRHTYASRLVMGGVDLAVIRELLGHRDFETTLRYAHLAPSRMKEAVMVLERIYPVAGASTDQNGPERQNTHPLMAVQAGGTP
jgi:integrase